MAMNSPFGDVAPPFWQGGPDPSGYYQFPHANRVNSSQAVAPNTRSQYPITVGTSVFGLKCKGGVIMRPEALHCWLTRVLYNRRSKFDPLWNTIIVGGIQDGKPFLGCVDHIGTAWKENA